MAKKKENIQLTKEQGTGRYHLKIDEIDVTFANSRTVESFACNLYERISERETGVFRLQDREDGGLDIILNGNPQKIIRAKNWEQGQRLAERILQKLGEEQ